jgi:hypothetical protein
MTSDEKDNSNEASGGDDAPGSSKRPSRVIELEAEEVEIEVKSGEDESTGDGDAQDGDEDAGGTIASEKPGDRPKPPPQRTKPSDVKGFVTHLAAGLIGGLVGVVGAGFGLEKLPLAGLLGNSETPQQITGIEQRLDALDGKLAGHSKTLEGVASSQKLGALETRLAAVEKKPSAVPAVPQEITDRLGKLEDTLKTLGSAAGEEGASSLEVSAALTAKIDGVSSDLEKRTSLINEEFAGLKKSLEELATKKPSSNGQVESKFGERLDALERQISTLAARPAMPSGQMSISSGTGSAGAALALAFESLRRAVESGEAYTSQLEQLAKLAPKGIDLTKLKKTASGVDTERVLLRALSPLLHDARLVAAKPDDNNFLDRLVSNAQSVVRVRRIGPAQGDSDGAVLARMEAHMKSSGLADILREANGLSDPVRKTLQTWLDRAEALQTSQAALTALEESLLVSLKAGSKAQR